MKELDQIEKEEQEYNPSFETFSELYRIMCNRYSDYGIGRYQLSECFFYKECGGCGNCADFCMNHPYRAKTLLFRWRRKVLYSGDLILRKDRI